MITYLFYPRLIDGSALTFEAIDLSSDAEAMREARHVLSGHPSAVEVAVWDGERKVGRTTRRSSSIPVVALLGLRPSSPS